MTANISELCRSLVRYARNRIRSGMDTERGLARRSGISQPHLHNVLKGIRALSPRMCDLLMKGLDISVAELLWLRPEDVEPAAKAIPVMPGRIGPGAASASTE